MPDIPGIFVLYHLQANDTDFSYTDVQLIPIWSLKTDSLLKPDSKEIR